MKEKRVTKKAILASLLSVVVCSSMLIGTSYAWFTDSAVSSGNVIKSGKLDIELTYLDGTTTKSEQSDETIVPDPDDDNADWKDASQGAIFAYDLWEPGYVQVRHLKIENKGTLALKYVFAIQANGGLEENEYGHTLADVIDVYYVDPAVAVPNREALTEEFKLGTLAEVLDNMNSDENTAQGVLYPEGTDASVGHVSDTVTIALKMQESAGNEYQNMKLGTTFSVQVLATQYTWEKDSFDDQYDAMANGEPDNPVFPVVAVSTRQEFLDALDSVEDGGVIDFNDGNAIVLANTEVDKEVTIQNTNFDTSEVPANVNVYQVTFNKPVTFKNCTFNSELGVLSNNFKGGVTFENCTFDGDDNEAFYNNRTDGDVTFKNCDITAKWCYAININGGSAGHTLTIDHCNVAGWVSFSSPTLTKIVMKDSTFTGEYAPGQECDYKRVRFYQDAEVTNCTFTDSYEAIDACANNITVTFNGCTGVKGKLSYYTSGATNTDSVTWIHDGETIDHTDAAWFVA